MAVAEQAAPSLASFPRLGRRRGELHWGCPSTGLSTRADVTQPRLHLRGQGVENPDPGTCPLCLCGEEADETKLRRGQSWGRGLLAGEGSDRGIRTPRLRPQPRRAGCWPWLGWLLEQHNGAC